MAARLAATEERERQFLMSVSHELRTPLTAIKGHVDAIRDGLIDDPRARARVARRRRGRDDPARAARRRRARPREARTRTASRCTPQEVDMGVLVEQAYASFGEEARRREIDFRLDEDPERADDRHRRRPRPPGHHEPARERVPLDARRRHDRARLRAGERRRPGRRRDTGPGIKPEERERIFVPFISRDNHGTGLGLPIARELAVALGGRHRARVEVGRGQPLHARAAGGSPRRRSRWRSARGYDPPMASDPGETLTPRRPASSRAPRRRSPARAALVALRPRQWVKNLLLFAGIVFAAQIGDPVRWLRGGRRLRRLLRRLERRLPRQRRARRRGRPAAPGQAAAADRARRARRAARRSCSPGSLAVVALALAALLGPASVACLLALRRAPGRLHAAAQARRPRSTCS